MSNIENAGGFKIYRGADSMGLMESGCMSVAPMTDEQKQGMGKIVGAGLLNGDHTEVLVDQPGFHLLKAWFKKGYTLPLHSHDSDCLYYVVAGSLRLGTEDLIAGDSFFVPANVPYQYRPGDDGVEVLEFRHNTTFNFVNKVKGSKYWDKAAEALEKVVPDWALAERPSKVPAA